MIPPLCSQVLKHDPEEKLFNDADAITAIVDSSLIGQTLYGACTLRLLARRVEPKVLEVWTATLDTSPDELTENLYGKMLREAISACLAMPGGSQLDTKRMVEATFRTIDCDNVAVEGLASEVEIRLQALVKTSAAHHEQLPELSFEKLLDCSATGVRTVRVHETLLGKATWATTHVCRFVFLCLFITWHVSCTQCAREDGPVAVRHFGLHERWPSLAGQKPLREAPGHRHVVGAGARVHPHAVWRQGG